MIKDYSANKTLKKSRYTNCIVQYGLFPVVTVLKIMESKEKYEECEIIFNSIEEFVSNMVSANIEFVDGTEKIRTNNFNTEEYIKDYKKNNNLEDNASYVLTILKYTDNAL
jgi:hypothetical protein